MYKEMGISNNENKDNKSIDEEKEKIDRRRRNRRELRARKTMKRVKYRIIDKIDTFSIISNKKKDDYIIEHINDINQLETKKFRNSVLTESNISNINILKNNKYSNLNKYLKINELNLISNKNEYIKNKIQTYIIEYFNKFEIIIDKKTKYADSELLECNNVINITLEKEKRIKDEIKSINGIPINEIRIRKKRKNNNLNNISDIEKVKIIIKEIENKGIIKKILKEIKEKDILLNYNFCINCYQIVINKDIDNHSEHFILKINDFKDIEEELNYNEKLNKLYEILQNGHNKILKYRNNNLMKYYRKLLLSLYEIIINDNSFEELNSSIIRINEDYIKENNLGTFSDDLKILFLLFCQKISQLAYLKAGEISLLSESIEEQDFSFNELDDFNSSSNSNSNNEICFNNFTKEDKKKYFFKLGLNLKYKNNNNNNNISINDLYSQSKEQNIEINDYESFIMKELKIQN